MMHALERRMLLAFALDPTFGAGGKVSDALEPNPQGFSSAIGFIEQLGDGKLVIGGNVFPGGEVAVRAARFTPGGLRDTAFDGDGLSPVVDTPSGGGQAAGGAVQGDGKILVAASRDKGFAVVRYNANGSLDTTFGGGDGVAQTPDLDFVLDADATALALAADGKIVVVGSEEITGALHVVRFNADGSLDTSFDSDGIATLPQETIQALFPRGARAVEVLGDGKVLVLVVGDGFEIKDLALVRFNADGSPDTTFDGDGIRRFRFADAPSGDDASVMLLDAGKIVVGGRSGRSDDPGFLNTAAIARFNADGSFDTSFGGGDGVAFAGGEDGGGIVGMAVDNQGRYVGIRNQGHIVRWSSAGDADATLGPGGEIRGISSGGGPLIVDADGDIVTTDGTHLYRLTEAPRPQLELTENGTLIITNEAGNNTINVAPSGDNLIVTQNGVATSFPAADVLFIDILLGSGNDSVTLSTDRDTNIVLGDGANTLVVGNGAHDITGGSGVDNITTGNGPSQIDAGAGDDTIVIGGSAQGQAVSNIEGGDGDDTISVSGTGQGEVHVRGGAGNDSVAGGNGRDIFQGGDGNDTLDGGGGPDILYGMAGSDVVFGGDGDDQLYGGTGLFPDFLLNTGDDVLHGGDGNDYLVGTAGRDSLYGGAQKDILIGNAGSDLLTGGGGKDKLGGGGGHDRLYGGAADDQIDGENHNDRIFGQGGNDKLFGSRGLDALFGDAGDDAFFTRDGLADTVDGGSGDDLAVLFDDIDDILNATKAA